MRNSTEVASKEALRKSADLLVITSTTHYANSAALFATGPYVREIDIWAQLFGRVTVAAPCRHGEPPGDYLPYSSSQVSIHPVSETGGLGLTAKLKQLAMLPKLVLELSSAMRRADAIHVRCPGNLGLLGVLLAPFFSERRIAKYAMQWGGYPGEPWTYTLQRWLLRSRWWGAPVTVYGSRPGQPAHVISFFTSILDDPQMDRARRAARARTPLAGAHPHVLYVGRLTRFKNVDVLIQAVANLRDEGVLLTCSVIGDGPEGPALRQLAAASSAADSIRFVGAIPFNSVLDYYERADVLVLASGGEGWGKSIAEAMAFGLICIGSNRGPIPEMLGDGQGLVVTPRDVNGLAAHLRDIALNPAEFVAMRRAAARWGQRFTLSGLRDALRDVLEAQWDPKRPSTSRLDLMSSSETAI